VGSSHAGPAITPREREVLGQVVQGKTNQQIAVALGIAVPTVKATIVRLCQKMGLPNRVSLAAEAVRQGLVDAPKSPL
jgi:DNA-binding CsgD family transcriptional regulator